MEQFSDLYDGMLMKDMDRAIDISDREDCWIDKKIRVIGDYDIDGVNATYILLEGLEGLGAEVDYDIPNRMTDGGYGLSNAADRAGLCKCRSRYDSSPVTMASRQERDRICERTWNDCDRNRSS